MTSIARPDCIDVAPPPGEPDDTADASLDMPAMPLVDVRIDAVLDDLHGVVTIEQLWRNDEPHDIEGVYTFPLPAGAVVLAVEVELGERRLEGVVVARRQAEADYEAAITEGHAAVMLEQAESGLWTINVGNLRPAETARIRLRYALVHAYSGDTLRVALPTTIAPRYGAWAGAPHQAPMVSLTVEHRFALEVRLLAGLADAQVQCPTHTVTVLRSAEGRTVRFDGERVEMDRDVVLELRAPSARRDVGVVAPDHPDELATTASAPSAGRVALARWQPVFGNVVDAALRLVVVVDCSGSMAGDSIAQARQALVGILDALRPEDRVGLVFFGDQPHLVTRALRPATQAGLAPLREAVARLDADLGGTEIAPALDAAARLLGTAPGGHVLLITDGEVNGWEAVVDAHRGRGHRVFPVGVGAAVAEAFLRALATATRGRCEFVTPNEAMAGRIVRHFERMRAPQARSVRVHWPEGARGRTPATLDTVFSGDTVLLSAQLPAQATADEALEIVMQDDRGAEHRHRIVLSLADAALLGPAARKAAEANERPAAPPSGIETPIAPLARLAAAERIALAPGDEAATAIAVRYRLASRWTNWLVVAERTEAERAAGAPMLRQVPGMLAAGWGGTGRVAMSMTADYAVSSARMVMHSELPPESLPMRESTAQAWRSVDAARFDPAFAARRIRPTLRDRLLALLEADPHALDRDRILGDQWFRAMAALGKELEAITTAFGLDRIDVARLVADLVLNAVREPGVSADVRAALSSLRTEGLALRGTLGAEAVRMIEDLVAAAR